MRVFQAVGAAGGAAMGGVCLVRHAKAGLKRRVGTPDEELQAYRSAVHSADVALAGLEARAKPGDGEIFMVQRLMLQDMSLDEEVRAYICAGAGAAAAVERAAGIFAASLRSLSDAYLSQRAADVLDACQRVVDVLDGGPQPGLLLEQPAILVAQEIYPTDIVNLDRSMLLGIVTSRGAANAHVCILARSMGVPMAVMAGDGFLRACEDHTVALDGQTGCVYVNPTDAVRAEFARKMEDTARTGQAALRLRRSPCETRDGAAVRLYANCSDVRQVRDAVAEGAEGVGLLRSEYALLSRGAATEQQQYRFYAACLEAAQGRPVTVSVYDVGADKSTNLMRAHPEANPALGLRGIRFCLANEQMFLCQLRALLRAGTKGPLRIVLPMVAAPEDVEKARACLDAAKSQLRLRKAPFAQEVPLGILVETPAAALTADTMAALADFFVIGANNLAQFTYAADRASSLVQHYFAPQLPAVRRLIGMAAEAALRRGIPVAVTGTSAADPACAEAYLAMGVRALSMDARSIPAMKAFVRTLTLGENAAQGGEAAAQPAAEPL